MDTNKLCSRDFDKLNRRELFLLCTILKNQVVNKNIEKCFIRVH